MQRKPLRIGFSVLGDPAWYGGVALVYSTIKMLKTCAPRELEMTLLVPAGQSKPPEIEGLVDSIVELPRPHYPRVRRLTRRLHLRDFETGAFFRRQGLDAVAFDTSTEPLSVPTLRYIPDFQHRHLPDFFSDAEVESRNYELERLASAASRIVVTAECVKHDMKTFLPEGAPKTRVLRPVWEPLASTYARNPKEIVDKYHLPERFVYLPNQFWKHKNHERAFHAVKILRDRGIDVCLVCTGMPYDRRDPTYFARLLGTIAEWGIADAIRLLGFIPLEDVMSLTRQSLCVLSPSLFEGYALSVEHARSLGKPLLLSDIPAHREHAPPEVTYFNPLDVEELAKKLGEAWQRHAPGPHASLEEEAKRTLPDRMRAATDAFMKILGEVAA